MGILCFHVSFVSAEAKVEISVSTYPGDTALALAYRHHSVPSDLPVFTSSAITALIWGVN